MTLGTNPGQQIAVSALAATNGAHAPKPSIEFETEDATYGTYIRRLSYNGIVFNLEPVSMFGVGLYNATTPTIIELTDREWTPTISEDATTGVITITLALDSPYTGISFTVTLTPQIEGYQIALSAANTSTTYAVEWFEFPRLGCTAPSGDAANGWLAHGFCGGGVITTPYLSSLTAFGTAMESPPNMQFWDYYDISTKTHLYMATDDDAGYRKVHQLIGDGSNVTTQGMRHYYPNPRRAGNSGQMPYTHSYHVTLELFRGRGSDGRMGCYDSALRYRTWATNASRPWMVDGAWQASGNTVAKVIGSDFYYVRLLEAPATNANEWTEIVTDMIRCKDYVYSGDTARHMLGLLYGWAANMDFVSDFQPPAFYPLNGAGPGTNLNTALGTAATNNLHLSYYTIPQWWDTALTGAGNLPFRYDDFLGTSDYNSISQYVIRDKDDIPITNATLGDDLIPPVIIDEDGP